MIIAPSLLAADLGRLASEVKRAENAGADWLHVDIMDGHFVPNLSFGPSFVRTVRSLTKLPLDVHLMCSKPEILLEHFADAGATGITVHVELGDRVGHLLWKIKSLGLNAGLAVNPPTGIRHVLPYLDKINLLLVMTVNPGFGGQSFIEEAVPKIAQVATWRGERRLRYRVEVDGGITQETAGECARVGADTLVSGTALFCSRNLKSAIARMRKTALAVAPHLRPSPS